MNKKIIYYSIFTLLLFFKPVYAQECLPCHEAENESFLLTKHAQNKTCDICHDNPQKYLTEENKKGNISNPANFSLRKGNSICLSCHMNKDRDVGQRFRSLPNLHDSLRCYDCHQAHLKTSNNTGIDSFKTDMPVDCQTCHAENTIALSDSKHGTAGLACPDCHKLHEIKTISRDIEGQIEKCLSCHPTQELEFKSPYAHPLREKQIKCTDCHNPHSDKYDKMLKEEGDDDCRGCHANIIIEGGKHPTSKNTNHPFKTVKCLDCHKAHGSNFNSVLKYNANTICTTCHQ